MQIKDLREFIKKTPISCDDYELVNGEIAILPAEDEEEETIVYRVDKAIVAFRMDDNQREVCFLHQTQEDINTISGLL